MSKRPFGERLLLGVAWGAVMTLTLFAAWAATYHLLTWVYALVITGRCGL
jgi:hypothetical protein